MERLPAQEIVGRLGARDCASFAASSRWAWQGGWTSKQARLKWHKELREQAWEKTHRIWGCLARIGQLSIDRVFGVGETEFIRVVGQILARQLDHDDPTGDFDKADWAVYHTLWNYVTRGQHIEPTDDAPPWWDLTPWFLVFYSMEKSDLESIGW